MKVNKTNTVSGSVTTVCIALLKEVFIAKRTEFLALSGAGRMREWVDMFYMTLKDVIEKRRLTLFSSGDVDVGVNELIARTKVTLMSAYLGDAIDDLKLRGIMQVPRKCLGIMADDCVAWQDKYLTVRRSN